jgi:hypothetical protein
MEFPDTSFRIDFTRLLGAMGKALSEAFDGEAIVPGNLYFYTAIFSIPDTPDPEWGDISFIANSTFARRKFSDSAVQAGFDPGGIFDVPLRAWVVEKLRDRRYQEKMVDTSVVARLVEQAICDPERLHVLITGDTDMLPAISTVVPKYTETVILASTHPDQYNPSDAQSSFRLNQFEFRTGPIYLERLAEEMVQGDFVYRCSNPLCQRIFTRHAAIPSHANPFCKPCHEQRSTR